MIGEPVVDTSDPESAIDELVAAATRGPTAVEATMGAIIALRYREVERLAHDRRMAGVGLTFFDFMGIEGSLSEWYSELMFTNDGESHARMRRLVSRAFTPRSIENLRNYARSLVSAGFESLDARGGGELVEEFGRLGTRIMCRLLGVPDSDVEVFGRWADDLSRVFGFMDADQIQAASAALESLLSYTAGLVDRRDGEPADDLITALLGIEHEGDRLTRHEVVTMVANMLVAAHDTTASQLGCSLFALLHHPEAVGPIRSGQVRVGDSLIETMRYEPAIALFPRRALEPLEIGGVERPAGTVVLLSVASANRDSEVYADPGRFDVGRFGAPEVPRPLSFGTGPHYCLGANLARMAMEETIAGFVGREISLVDDQVRWRLVLGRGPAHLPVRATALA